jgi:hypothetical protein
MIAEQSNGVYHQRADRLLSASDSDSDNACHNGTQPSINGRNRAWYDGAPPSTIGDNGASQPAELRREPAGGIAAAAGIR